MEAPVIKAKDGSAIPFFRKQKKAILMSSNCSDHLEVASEIDGHVIASLNAMRKCSSDSWLVSDKTSNPVAGRKDKKRIFEVELADGSKKHITPNNPWNFSENNKEYFLRRRQQAQNILAAMEENGKNDHAKNIGIYTVQECGYDHTLVTLINKNAEYVTGKDIEARKSELPGMKDLMVVYDKKKYELVEETPIFEENSDRGKSYGGIVYKFLDRKTGKYISVLNRHLAYGKDYEEETEKVVQRLIKNDDLLDKAPELEDEDTDDETELEDDADVLEESDLTQIRGFKKEREDIDEATKEEILKRELTKLKGGEKPPYLIVACGDTNGPVAKIKASLAPDGATCSDNLEKESRLPQHQNAKYSNSTTPNDYRHQKITHGETAEKKTYTETRVLYFQPESEAKKTIKCKLLSGYCLDSDGSKGGTSIDYRGGFLRKNKERTIELSQEDLDIKAPTPTPKPREAIELELKEKAIEQIKTQIEKIITNTLGAVDKKIKTLFQKSLEAQKYEHQPKGPYQGIGVRANVKVMKNGKIGAQIVSVFSPELQRFKINDAAPNYIENPQAFLEGKFITSITKEDGTVVDVNELAQKNGGMKDQRFLKQLVSYFHGEKGDIKITLCDEKGENIQTVSCQRNEKTVFVGGSVDAAKLKAGSFASAVYNPEKHGVEILTKFNEMLENEKAKIPAPALTHT